MTEVRVVLGVLGVLLLVGFAAGCGLVSDQTKQEAKKKVEAKGQQAKQEAKKKVEAKGQQVKQEVKGKVEAGQEDLEKKVDDVQKDVNDLEKKMDELLKKVDALEQQDHKKQTKHWSLAREVTDATTAGPREDLLPKSARLHAQYASRGSGERGSDGIDRVAPSQPSQDWELVELYEGKGKERVLSEHNVSGRQLDLALAYHEMYPREIDEAIEDNARSPAQWHEISPSVIPPPTLGQGAVLQACRARMKLLLDTYSHVLPNMQDSAARALEEALR